MDANGTLAQGEEAYDAFLHRYPYCYGYWKKYADFEKRKGKSQEKVSKFGLFSFRPGLIFNLFSFFKVRAVFEAGMEAIPLSADLWIHYLNWVRGNVKEGTSNEDEVRMEYERAVQVRKHVTFCVKKTCDFLRQNPCELFASFSCS